MPLSSSTCDEAYPPNQPPAGMLPAQERFGPDMNARARLRSAVDSATAVLFCSARRSFRLQLAGVG